MASFITVDRKILKWEWYQDVKVFHLFLYFLLRANWEDGRWKGIEVKRGQLISGRLKLSKDTGLSEMEIRTCINKLKTTNEITTKVTNKYTIITICKYDVYQNRYDQSNQQLNQQANQRTTNEQPTINQQLTTNNTPNNNKEEDNSHKKEFINKPLPEHFNGLPEIKIGSVIQYFKVAKQTDVTSEQVCGLWEVFKVQNLTGKKFYLEEDDVYSHFTNWVIKKKIENNGNNNTTKKVITDFKSAGANLSADRIGHKLSQIK